MSNPIWKPSADRIKNANLTAFMDFVKKKEGLEALSFSDLYQWSITHIGDFWQSVADFCGAKFTTEPQTILKNEDKIEEATFFEGATLNYAENLLCRRDQDQAIVFWGEDKVKRALSFEDLYNKVSQVAQQLKDLGLEPGDRVGGFVPNSPEAIIFMLATTSLGGVWTSCSPDFGVSAVIDRFGQVEPKFLVSADKYFYRGKEFSCLEKVEGIQQQLPSLKKTFLFSYEGADLESSTLANTITLTEIEKAYASKDIDFVPVDFDHPLYIMYSSGTTGVPKCIVHGVGGTLLQHLKEHQLHSDIKPNDRVFYFSTCGWMMWNWQVTALASKATLLIYDGSPVYPTESILFDFAAEEKMTFFGTAAKVIDELKKRDFKPKESHDLSALQNIASTGSPLVEESYDYIYSHIKEDIGVMSISGGTDIISCFVLGNPIAPVWRGEIQTPGLGMSVQIFDDNGNPIRHEKGELVCTKPFPSMPIGFWGDADGQKYHNAYFNTYDNVWCHGDFAAFTENDGLVIYGRSDTILNPGGVRIGTAEIYRQVEKVDEVLESIVVGQHISDDVRVILFVRLKDGVDLTDDLIAQIKKQIRQNTTPRHVPALILQVADIPRTKSGKLVELAVKNVIEKRPIKNKDALANPESLSLFENLEALQVN